MHMALRSALAVVAACAMGGSQLALAELPSDRPANLKDCLDYAMANHSYVLSAQKRVEASRADVTRARSGYLPKLSADSDYSHSDFTGAESARGTAGIDSSGSRLSHTLSLTQTLLDGWRTPTAVRQASASERAALADLDQARQQRVLAVTTAYFESLLAGRLAEIAQQTVREVEEQRVLIQARIDAGDAAQIDIYPVDVQLAEAKLASIRTGNSKRVAANALRNAIGLPPGPALELVDAGELPPGVPSLEECVTAALRDRPDLASAAADIDSQRAALSFARLQRRPVPAASAVYRRGYGDSAYDSEWQIGAGLTMYVFDGGALAADVRSARARLESLDLNYEQMVRDIRTEVEQAYLNHISALEQLEATRSNVALARTNVEVAREKYQVGLGIPLEITVAERQYSEAQANHAQALYDSHITRARLDTAMGRRDF